MNSFFQKSARLTILLTLLFTIFAFSLNRSAVAKEPAKNETDGMQKKTKAFELKQTERIVLLGGGFLERDQEFGYLDAFLTTAFPQKNITVRNLGWSGDTVWAESRGLFDDPEKGYERMLVHINRLKPTLIFLSYGANEATAKKADVKKYLAQYEKLVADLQKTNARLIIIAPQLLEQKPAPYPNIDAANKKIRTFLFQTMLFAQKEKIPFLGMQTQSGVPLSGVPSQCTQPPLTTDSVQFTEAGYQKEIHLWAKQLGWKEPTFYKHPQWKTLQTQILKKNRLYFYRWRPQNITYLTLFRKHEQGNNAADLPKFEPLVEQAEKEIQTTIKSFQK